MRVQGLWRLPRPGRWRCHRGSCHEPVREQWCAPLYRRAQARRPPPLLAWNVARQPQCPSSQTYDLLLWAQGAGSSAPHPPSSGFPGRGGGGAQSRRTPVPGGAVCTKARLGWDPGELLWGSCALGALSCFCLPQLSPQHSGGGSGDLDGPPAAPAKLTCPTVLHGLAQDPDQLPELSACGRVFVSGAQLRPTRRLRPPKASGWALAAPRGPRCPTPHHIQACCWPSDLCLTFLLGCITTPENRQDRAKPGGRGP